jgi:hypothetical protein
MGSKMMGSQLRDGLSRAQTRRYLISKGWDKKI